MGYIKLGLTTFAIGFVGLISLAAGTAYTGDPLMCSLVVFGIGAVAYGFGKEAR